MSAELLKKEATSNLLFRGLNLPCIFANKHLFLQLLKKLLKFFIYF